MLGGRKGSANIEHGGDIPDEAKPKRPAEQKGDLRRK